ncbi:MAG: type II toxin-antitoxin system VapC family toxin [Nitrospira sp.]|nr:type II toxin-antitoxin system VapC family toxin [Nitrospira sp.]
MKDSVLDATAVLAVLNDEPGAEKVVPLLPRAVMSTVNLAEVVSKLADAGMPEETIHTVIDELGIMVIPFDEPLAFSTGFLRPATSDYGLSLGDRACLALGTHLHRPVLTADRMWSTLKLDVAIQMIR